MKPGLVVLASALFTSSSIVQAGSVLDTIITELHFSRSDANMVLVRTSTPVTAKAGCSIHIWAFVLKTGTPFEDKIYAALLAAKAALSTVNLHGTGTCPDHEEVESLLAVTIKD